MNESFTIQTAQQFINELAEEKITLNVCDINQNSAPIKLMNVKIPAKLSASPAIIEFGTLVAELAKGRFNLPVAIKLFRDSQDPHILGLKYEARVYQFIMKNILEPAVSPNFVSFVAYGCCFRDKRCFLMTEKVGSGVQFNKNKLFPVQTLYELYPTLKLREKYQVLFQIVYSLEAMNRFKMAHNDLHSNNILVMILDESVVLRYILDESGKTFTVKTRFIPYIFDWDVSIVEVVGINYKTNENFFDTVLDVNVFDPIRDLYTLFCYLGQVDSDITIVSTYAKNPTLLAKEAGEKISIDPTVRKKIERNFYFDRMVADKKIYKLSLAEFESYVGKNKAPKGISVIYFTFEGQERIVLWNPYICRLSSKSVNFPTPLKLLQNQFKMFETEKEIETPFVYHLPTDEEIESKIIII